MNLETICDNLAARYLAPTIGTPTGAAAMRTAYGQMPNSTPMTPCVVIVPQDGEVVYGPGTRKSEHRIDVNFYLAKQTGDLARNETARQLWLGYLLNATHGAMQLGLAGTVDKAIPTGYEFVELPYGGDMYDGIIVHVTVFVTEPVTLTP